MKRSSDSEERGAVAGFLNLFSFGIRKAVIEEPLSGGAFCENSNIIARLGFLVFACCGDSFLDQLLFAVISDFLYLNVSYCRKERRLCFGNFSGIDFNENVAGFDLIPNIYQDTLNHA